MPFLYATASTHVGLIKHQNEDGFASFPEEGIFVVADGMSGSQGGGQSQVKPRPKLSLSSFEPRPKSGVKDLLSY